MRKGIIALVTVAISCAVVIAGMDDVSFPASDLKPAYTQTNTFVMRGYLERIEMVQASPDSTVSNTVTITDASKTLVSYSFTNTATIFPRTGIHSTAGAALGNSTNTPYDKIAVAGTVTVKQAGLGPATNDWALKIIYAK